MCSLKVIIKVMKVKFEKSQNVLCGTVFSNGCGPRVLLGCVLYSVGRKVCNWRLSQF